MTGVFNDTTGVFNDTTGVFNDTTINLLFTIYQTNRKHICVILFGHCQEA